MVVITMNRTIPRRVVAIDPVIGQYDIKIVNGVECPNLVCRGKEDLNAQDTSLAQFM